MKNKKVIRLLSLVMASILFCTSCSGKTQEKTVSEPEQSIEETVDTKTEEEEETVKETKTSSEEVVVEEGVLPVHWNLAEVYPDADAWQADYDRATELLSQYESYRGTLHSAEAIYNYLEFAYMGELTRLEGKLSLYADLGYNLNPTDSVYKNMKSQLGSLFAKEKELGAFAEPEIYELPIETRKEIFSDPIFAGMEYALKDYTDPEAEPFSEETNQVMSMLSMGEGYAYKTFEILNSVELPDPVITMPDGTEEKLTRELYTDIIYSDEYEDDFKKEANQIYLTKPIPLINTFASLLEENAAQAYASAKVNKYETTREAALDTYDVDPAVYDMLIEAAHNGLEDHQRFFRIHAKGLGLEELMSYQMADYISQYNPEKMAYDDAVAEVTEALGVLGDEYVTTFSKIMESGHVDVYPSDTKTTGAFEMQPSSEYLPWMLFNYKGYSDDVSTIAHEGGHAVYSEFAVEN